jgi:hypothetical protein
MLINTNASFSSSKQLTMMPVTDEELRRTLASALDRLTQQKTSQEK